MAVLDVIQKTVPEQQGVVYLENEKDVLVAPQPSAGGTPPSSTGTRSHGHA